MTTKGKSGRPLSAVITVPDPDNKSFSNHAHRGGTMQWRTESHRYSRFEIRFHGANPFNSEVDKVFGGTDVKPVVVRLNRLGEIKYTVRHYPPKGPYVDSGPFSAVITICPACPPWNPKGNLGD